MSKALQKLKTIFFRAVGMEKERDALTTKYEEPRSCVKGLASLANKDMAHLDAEVITITHERDASVRKGEQLGLEGLCVLE